MAAAAAAAVAMEGVVAEWALVWALVWVACWEAWVEWEAAAWAVETVAAVLVGEALEEALVGV